MSFDIGWLPLGVLILFTAIFVIRAHLHMRYDLERKPLFRWALLLEGVLSILPSIKWVMIGFLIGSLTVFVLQEAWLWLYSTPLPFNPFVRGSP